MAGMIKRGTMLPPNADIVKIISVPIPCACARDLAIEARKTPIPEMANDVESTIKTNASRFLLISNPNASHEKINITVNCEIERHIAISILPNKMEPGLTGEYSRRFNVPFSFSSSNPADKEVILNNSIMIATPAMACMRNKLLSFFSPTNDVVFNFELKPRELLFDFSTLPLMSVMILCFNVGSMFGKLAFK